MIYGYIRVSSDKQTVENQRFEINNFCERYKLVIDGWIEETISGMKSYNKRELGRLLLQIQKDDLIICAELSRLGAFSCSIAERCVIFLLPIHGLSYLLSSKASSGR